MTVAPIQISAEEINCLIHAYFQDSGFTHSAFSLRSEARLEQTPHYRTFVQRGALVDLLGKALLYSEVEAHWRADTVTSSCAHPFTLLTSHVCSADARTRPLPVAEKLQEALENEPAPSTGQKAQQTSTKGSVVADGKRKAADTTAENRTEKRVRTSSPMNGIEEGELSKAGTSKASSRSAKQTSMAETPKTQYDNWAIRKLQGHKAEVFVCAWNPSKPDLLATGDRDALVNYWNIPIAPSALPATSAPPHLLPNYSVPTSKEAMCDLTAIDWSPDGLLLAVASYDSIMRILTASGELYMTDPVHKAPVFASKFSKSGKWLLTGSLDGTACVWNVPAKKLEIMYRCHIDCCLDVAWIEEDVFATCGADKLVHIVQVGTTNPLMSLAGHTNEVNSIEYNPKTQQLVSCSDDRTARIWSIGGLLKQAKDRKSNGVAKAIAPPKSDPQSAGGSPIPGFGADSTSTKNGEGDALPPCVVLRGHKNNVSTVDWCPRTPAGEHPMIATSSFDGTTRLWDSVTGTCLQTFADHKTPVFSVIFSPDGRFLATGGGDGWLIIYDTKAREKRWAWDSSDGAPDLTQGDGTSRSGASNESGEATKMMSKGIFDIDWQMDSDRSRLAVTLETKQVAILDMRRIPELQA